jgi:membrane protein implicated in regulation of membrane protease activity
MLLLGAILLAVLVIDPPAGWILVGIAAVLEIGELAFWVRWNRRRHAEVGAETLVGRYAVVVVSCRPEGQVRLDGELWQARCEEGASAGETVVVERLEGLTLSVLRAPETPTGGLHSS